MVCGLFCPLGFSSEMAEGVKECLLVLVHGDLKQGLKPRDECCQIAWVRLSLPTLYGTVQTDFSVKDL